MLKEESLQPVICADTMNSIHEKNTVIIPETPQVNNTRRLFDYLKQHPIIDIKRTAKALGLSYSTTSSAVKN